MTNQQQSRHEKGQSLVELAFSVVLILILLAGIVDLARLALAFSVVRDAAQEAATFGAAYPTYCEATVARALNSASGNFAPAGMSATPVIIDGSTPSNCSASNVNACSDGNNRIQVTVTGQFTFAMPFIGTFVGQTIPVRYTVTNDILRPVCP